jgi:hypothetical protein
MSNMLLKDWQVHYQANSYFIYKTDNYKNIIILTK